MWAVVAKSGTRKKPVLRIFTLFFCAVAMCVTPASKDKRLYLGRHAPSKARLQSEGRLLVAFLSVPILHLRRSALLLGAAPSLRFGSGVTHDVRRPIDLGNHREGRLGASPACVLKGAGGRGRKPNNNKRCKRHEIR